MQTAREDVSGTVARRPPDVTAVARTVAAAPEGYGGLVTRAIAAAADALIIDVIALFVAAVVALILSIFPATHDTKTVIAVIGGAAYVVWAIGYFVTFWSTTGQTPGDRMMRLRVLREDGSTIGPLRAAVRLAAAVLGLVLLLGYLPILLNDRRRAFHDWVAGTVVVNDPSTTKET